MLFTGVMAAPLANNMAATPPQSYEVTATPELTADEPVTKSTPAVEVISSAQKDKLAKCLTSKGAIMYGAFWCPHCSQQKELFGDSFKLIKYQECDVKGPNGNPMACKTAEIKAYPTWIIPGSANLEGTTTLEDLAKAANCPLT